MCKSILVFLFILSLLAPSIFAQSDDQSSSGSGVLVSHSNQTEVSDQDQQNPAGDGIASDPSGQGTPDSSGHHKHHHDDSGDSQSSATN